jgi:hypothetical protein
VFTEQTPSAPLYFVLAADSALRRLDGFGYYFKDESKTLVNAILLYNALHTSHLPRVLISAEALYTSASFPNQLLAWCISNFDARSTLREKSQPLSANKEKALQLKNTSRVMRKLGV